MPEPSTPTVCIIGALHVDEIAIASALLVKGESNPVQWERRIGGVAANVARAASRFLSDANKRSSIAVKLFANVGKDSDGQRLVQLMNKQGVEVVAAPQSQPGTGRYSAVLDTNGDVFIGLADVAQAEKLTWQCIHRYIEEASPICVIVDGNLSAATLDQFSADIGDRQPLPYRLIATLVSPAKAHRFKALLKKLDILFCNRSEANALLSAFQTEPEPKVTIEAMLMALVSQGCKHVVMTNGAQGVHVASDAQHTHISAITVETVFTLNGPGDALAGAVVFELLTNEINHDSLVNAVEKVGLSAANAVLRGYQSAPLITHPSTSTSSIPE